MKINVYPCFKTWQQFNNIYLYSDPHFSDKEMQNIRKNYITDEEQIRRINSKLGKKDLIIFLGDIGNTEFVTQIKGYKILIQGNHDIGASKYQRQREDGVDNHLFDEVYEGPVIINEKLILSHEPIDTPYFFNIHGHDHANSFRGKNHFNCCAEHINYTPISLKEIIMSGELKKVQSIHRATIDNATIRAKKRNQQKLGDDINK